MIPAPPSPRWARARRLLCAAAAITAVLATACTPGTTRTGAYLTAQETVAGNEITSAKLGPVTGLTSTRGNDGSTTIRWNAATEQAWATANGVTSGIEYTVASTTKDGCAGATTANSITGKWPAGTDCTITYTAAGWTSPAAAITVPSSVVTVGMQPISIAIAPDGSRAYVANRWSSDVSVIETATLAVSTSTKVTTATDLTSIAVSKNDLAYAVGLGSFGVFTSLASIDPTKKVTSWMLDGGASWGIAYSPQEDSFYIVSDGYSGSGASMRVIKA